MPYRLDNFQGPRQNENAGPLGQNLGRIFKTVSAEVHTKQEVLCDLTVHTPTRLRPLTCELPARAEHLGPPCGCTPNPTVLGPARATMRGLVMATGTARARGCRTAPSKDQNVSRERRFGASNQSSSLLCCGPGCSKTASFRGGGRGPSHCKPPQLPGCLSPSTNIY